MHPDRRTLRAAAALVVAAALGACGGGGEDELGPGMLDAAAIDRLAKLKGRALDQQFRRLMARHHRGGLDLVEQQLAAGTNPRPARWPSSFAPARLVSSRS